MQGIVVSLNENLLKVTITDQEGFKSGSRQLDAALASNSQILNADLFSDQLDSLLQEVGGPKTNKLPLNFLIEPNEVYLYFVTIPKNEQDIEEQVVSQVSGRLDNVKLEELYFSYQKIAPFVYQFIGVKQETVNKILGISTRLGMDLHSIVPWLGLLPKFLSDNNPAIFISKSNRKQVVALSELNGIYFSGVYDKDKTKEELQQLVQELSVYKRSDPIKRVFTINYDNFALDDSYQVMALPLPTSDLTQDGDYKLHILLRSVVDSKSEILETQLNMLNLLPLPVEAKSKSPMVYVGAAGIVLMLVAAGVGAYLFFSDDSATGEVAGESNGDTEVVSTTEETPETTESEITNDSEGDEGDTSASDEVAVEDLNKDDLVIRIENGAGIAGVAGNTQTKLEELGYTIESIGNSENQERDNTLISFKTSKIQFRDLLIADLKDDFEIVFEEGLDDSEAYDVLIVVGRN